MGGMLLVGYSDKNPAAVVMVVNVIGHHIAISARTTNVC